MNESSEELLTEQLLCILECQEMSGDVYEMTPVVSSVYFLCTLGTRFRTWRKCKHQ